MIVLHHGDCLDELKKLPDNYVDSIVTDPPYGLSFMGKKWDYDVPSEDIWRECLRVLKPGGHLLAFAGTRTQHRMAVRIEDAGFEIRDMIAWIYGSGFPKSLNIGKAVDKLQGNEREVVFDENRAKRLKNQTGNYESPNGMKSVNRNPNLSKGTSPYEGWGTALKPALEPITVARKPLSEKTVAENVLTHGTGGINIDGCRVGTDEIATNHTTRPAGDHLVGYAKATGEQSFHTGRFPANLIHDGSEEVVELFPNDAARFFMTCKVCYNKGVCHDQNQPHNCAAIVQQSLFQLNQHDASVLVGVVNSVLPEGLLCVDASLAISTPATENDLKMLVDSSTQTIVNIDERCWLASKPQKLTLSNSLVNAVVQIEPTDTTTITISHWKSDGSADPVTFSITRLNLEPGAKDYARLRYCAKASKKDRDEGLEGFEERQDETHKHGMKLERWPDGTMRERVTQPATRRNNHPTVKPTDLMRYLCRLVTPTGGIVLDPFMGSGSTGKAAVKEGFSFIGIEREADYVEIAKARINP